MREKTDFRLLVSLLPVLSLVLAGCGGEGEKKQLRERLRTSQQARGRARGRLEETRRELARAEAQLAGREDDLSVATAIVFSCALATLLLTGLLIRERRARLALLRILRELKRRLRGEHES